MPTTASRIDLSGPPSPRFICLSGDACVLCAAERAGNALYGARVDLKFGGGLPHAHAPRQSRPNPFSQLLRDRPSSGLIQRAPVPRDLGLPVVALRSFVPPRFLQGATYSDNLEQANIVPARKTSSELWNVSEMAGQFIGHRTRNRAGKVPCRRTCRDAPSGPGAARSNEVPANACGRVGCFDPASGTPCGARAPIECRSRRTLRGGALSGEEQRWGKHNRNVEPY
jgi:hypothetical protein